MLLCCKLFTIHCTKGLMGRSRNTTRFLVKKLKNNCEWPMANLVEKVWIHNVLMNWKYITFSQLPHYQVNLLSKCSLEWLPFRISQLGLFGRDHHWSTPWVVQCYKCWFQLSKMHTLLLDSKYLSFMIDVVLLINACLKRSLIIHKNFFGV